MMWFNLILNIMKRIMNSKVFNFHSCWDLVPDNSVVNVTGFKFNLNHKSGFCKWSGHVGSLFLVLIFSLFSNFLTAQITVDGNPFNWNSANFNASVGNYHISDAFLQGKWMTSSQFLKPFP